MAKKSLSLIPVMHSNDGTLVLLINGREYTYWCDNAKVLGFLRILRKQKANKGKALAIFKRDATLLRSTDSKFEPHEEIIQ